MIGASTIATATTTACISARYGARTIATNQLRFVTTAAALAFSSACGGSASNDVRGHGLSVATVAAATQAHIYEAAARGAFDVDNTSLLLDRRILPREIGLAPAGTLSPDIAAEMRRRNAVHGTCQPPLQGQKGTAKCTADVPGYVVRFSPVFSLRGDSVEVYLYAQKYDTPSSGYSEPLRFERAYQVVKRGDEWHAAREGRIPKEVRGEGR
jgi:hypothetical protein